MDVNECIDAYRSLMKTVFEKKKSGFAVSFRGTIKARFSSKALEAAIKQVIGSRDGVSVDDAFHNQSHPQRSGKCKV